MFSRGGKKRGRDSEIVKEGGGRRREGEERKRERREWSVLVFSYHLVTSFSLFFPLLSFLSSISKIRRFTHFEYEVSLRERWLKLWWDFRFLFGEIINGRLDLKSLLPLSRRKFLEYLYKRIFEYFERSRQRYFLSTISPSAPFPPQFKSLEIKERCFPFPGSI